MSRAEIKGQLDSILTVMKEGIVALQRHRYIEVTWAIDGLRYLSDNGHSFRVTDRADDAIDWLIALKNDYQSL